MTRRPSSPLSGRLARGNAGAVGTSIEVPETIAGLLAWFDPDAAYVTKDGSDKVSSWVSREGNAYTLDQASGPAQPTWSATAIQSRPGMTYGGAAYLGGAAALAAAMDGVADYTIVVVNDTDGAGAGTYYTLWSLGVAASAANQISHRSYDTTGYDRHYRGSAGTGLTSSGTQSLLTPNYLRAWVDGNTSITTTVDDVASLTAAAWTGNIACDTCYVGVSRYSGSFNSYYSGKISDILIYDHDLTAGEWSSLKSWITGKYVGI